MQKLKIAGLTINKRVIVHLVCRALNMAIKSRRPIQELIWHSDRLSHYHSHQRYC